MNQRRTMTTVAVYRALAAAPPDDRYAYALAGAAGVATSTAARIVDRLVEAGWAVARWELPPPAGRPPRRLVELTDDGHRGIADVLAAPVGRPPRRRPAGGEIS
jgi:DNA-binding MarR family transcriptional regulator